MTVSTSKEPARIAGMFDAIARRYDTLNHVLSAGLDYGWRRRAVRELRLTGRELVVDVCTGTGDLAMAAANGSRGHAGRVVGVDFSAAMLDLGGDKVRRAGLSSRVHFVRADATRLPLADASCDAAMVAFGIRNVVDLDAGLQELHRVVRPGGQLAILEFGMPRCTARTCVTSCRGWDASYRATPTHTNICPRRSKSFRPAARSRQSSAMQAFPACATSEWHWARSIFMSPVEADGRICRYTAYEPHVAGFRRLSA